MALFENPPIDIISQRGLNAPYTTEGIVKSNINGDSDHTTWRIHEGLRLSNNHVLPCHH